MNKRNRKILDQTATTERTGTRNKAKHTNGHRKSCGIRYPAQNPLGLFMPGHSHSFHWLCWHRILPGCVTKSCTSLNAPEVVTRWSGMSLNATGVVTKPFVDSWVESCGVSCEDWCVPVNVYKQTWIKKKFLFLFAFSIAFTKK